MKIVIFGTGKYFTQRRQELLRILYDDNIVCFVDNKITNDTVFEGKPIHNPGRIAQINFDCIVLMSLSHREMAGQLSVLGIPKTKILRYEEYKAKKLHGEIQLYTSRPMNGHKKILIATWEMGYNGGTLAAIYAAMALSARKYDVWLAASSCDEKLIREIKSLKINLAVCPSLPYMENDDFFLLQQFDFIIVNTFQMINFAAIASQLKPALWWIHEPAYSKNNHYELSRYYFPQWFVSNTLSKIRKVVVSEKTKKNFEKYYPDIANDVMVYGIPDFCNNNVPPENIKSAIVFAIIGGVQARKGQDVFIEAAYRLMKNSDKEVHFWIIGSIGDNEFAQRVKRQAEQIKNVKFWGMLNRAELCEILPQIDVMVCSSRDETMSMVITESMMQKKVCIVSDGAGIAKFIKEGENGFVFRNEDSADLAKKMWWVINNRQRLQTIGENARVVYDRVFSMNKFADCLERQISLTEEMRKNELQI